jgi:hypothetical protein
VIPSYIATALTAAALGLVTVAAFALRLRSRA